MWMIYKLTGSLIMMGTIMAVNALTSLLFGLIAGVFVDRMTKRKVMIITDLLRGASTAFIALLFITGSLEIYYLYIFTFFNSCCEVFASPARASAMQLLVRREHYLAANSLREASTSTAQIIGAGIAAVILGTWGIGAAVLIDAFTFIISAFTAIVARIDESMTADNKPLLSVKVILNEMKEGIDIIKSSIVLSVTVAMACLVNLLLTPFNILVPVYSDKILMTGSKGYSLIEMSFTIGIIIGAITLGQLGGKFKKSTLILVGFAALGMGIGLLSIIKNLYLAIITCGIAGAFTCFINTSAITIVQEITPKDKMGRVFSILGTLCMLGMPVGYAVSGFIASGLDVQYTFFSLGLLICILVVPVMFIKEFKKY
jgi:DHA3 family macrolide efflux protein-like MFS transporter